LFSPAEAGLLLLEVGMALWGMGLQLVGMLMAITHPSTAAAWGDEDTPKRDMRLWLRYYPGLALIVAGTLMQMWVEYWK
jgi:hypothetical protein